MHRALIATLLVASLTLACSSDGAPRDAGWVDLDGQPFPFSPDRFTPPRPHPRPWDAPLPACNVGAPCTPDRGCRSGSCQAQFDYVIGGEGDEIVGHPGGATGIPATYFTDGYCTPAPLAMPMTGCNPADAMACGDPDCARCIDLGGVVMCMRSCTPTATDNSECPQDGQTCLFAGRYCFDGCQSHDQCRLYREPAEDDVAWPGGEPPPRPLHYDADSRATCNFATGRCDQPSGGGLAGDPCLRTSQCEMNGLCLADFPDGGYCTRLGCDVLGIACEGDGKCQSRRAETAMCGQPCTVGAEAGDPTLVTGAAGHGVDCRPGYACAWDGTGVAGTVNGICLPGVYNDRTENNVGAPCDASAEVPDCYSPFGQGTCLGGDGTFWGPDNDCSILDCDAPGLPSDICGAAAQCVRPFRAAELDIDVAICLETCITADSCNTGDACIPAILVERGVLGSVCFPLCTETAQCRSGQTCRLGAGGFGECTR